MYNQNFGLLRENLGVGGSLPIVRHCLKGGVYGISVSVLPTCFVIGYSFSPLMGRSYLVSGFLSERGIDPSVAIYSVHPWEEGNLGASSSTILLIYQFTLFPKVQSFKSFNYRLIPVSTRTPPPCRALNSSF